jgi:hypothetical protein
MWHRVHRRTARRARPRRLAPPETKTPSPIRTLQLASTLSHSESTSCTTITTNNNKINIFCKNHRGVGASRVRTLQCERPSDALSSLESHPCATLRANSHEITSLRQNQGVGGDAGLLSLSSVVGAQHAAPHLGNLVASCHPNRRVLPRPKPPSSLTSPSAFVWKPRTSAGCGKSRVAQPFLAVRCS